MQIIMRGQITDANVEPVLLVLSPADLENITKMHTEKKRFYMAFPEKENKEFCRSIFERWKKMFENFERKRLQSRNLHL